jgi:large subunit ribosomal protein L21
MYAIVEIAGQQFKVEEGKKIFVHRLEAEAGNNVDFDQVLLIENDGNITIGEPTIKDAFVEGKVIDDTVRGDKVIVFKKKRKKGYRIKNGHRQNFSQVEIIGINVSGAPRKVSEKKEVVKPAKVKASEEPAEEKKAATKKPAAKKEAPAKKTAEKKPAEKKPAAKKTAKGKE